METKTKLTNRDIETLIQEYPLSVCFEGQYLKEIIQKDLQNSNYSTIDEVREDLHQEKKYSWLKRITFGAVGTYAFGISLMMSRLSSLSDLEATIVAWGFVGVVVGGGIGGAVISNHCLVKRNKYRDKLSIPYWTGHPLGG